MPAPLAIAPANVPLVVTAVESVAPAADDQIVPLATTARRAVELLPQGRLSVYEGAGHGLPVTHKDQLNAELLAFLRS